MQVTHPAENPPDSVRIGGEEYDVTDGALDLPGRRAANTLARRFGVHPATIREDLCSEVIGSGPREGEVCGKELPCQFHSEDE